MKYTEEELVQIAHDLRYLTVQAIAQSGSGHLGGSLSLAEILSCLYFDWLSIDPVQPQAPDRDRVILSKGHGAPALYSALALRGFFPVDELMTLRSLGSRLQGHPDMLALPGIDFNSGSLGQGLSVGLGMALASKLQKKNNRIVVILGDGELNEGQILEAAAASAHYQASNLLAIVDWNCYQQDGLTESILGMKDIAGLWNALGWKVEIVNGHSIPELQASLSNAKADHGNQPFVILAQTIKGKGISFAENSALYHNQPLDEEYAAQALAELGELIWKH